MKIFEKTGTFSNFQKDLENFQKDLENFQKTAKICKGKNFSLEVGRGGAGFQEGGGARWRTRKKKISDIYMYVYVYLGA